MARHPRPPPSPSADGWAWPPASAAWRATSAPSPALPLAPPPPKQPWWSSRLLAPRNVAMTLASLAFHAVCIALHTAATSFTLARGLAAYGRHPSPPLSDVLHDALPPLQQWRVLPEVGHVIPVLALAAHILALTDQRSLDALRTFLWAHGTLMALRALSFTGTLLPDPSRSCHDSLFIGSCHDLVFSGHAMILTLAGLVHRHFFALPPTLDAALWANGAGVLFMVVASRNHYTVDVVVAVVVTTAVFVAFTRHPSLVALAVAHPMHVLAKHMPPAAAAALLAAAHAGAGVGGGGGGGDQPCGCTGYDDDGGGSGDGALDTAAPPSAARDAAGTAAPRVRLWAWLAEPPPASGGGGDSEAGGGGGKGDGAYERRPSTVSAQSCGGAVGGGGGRPLSPHSTRPPLGSPFGASTQPLGRDDAGVQHPRRAATAPAGILTGAPAAPEAGAAGAGRGCCVGCAEGLRCPNAASASGGAGAEGGRGAAEDPRGPAEPRREAGEAG